VKIIYAAIQKSLNSNSQKRAILDPEEENSMVFSSGFYRMVQLLHEFWAILKARTNYHGFGSRLLS